MRPHSKAFRRNPTGTALLIGFILYGWTVASTLADDNASAEIVAEWEFGTKEDIRKDGWPDGWVRRSGPDYPKFLPIHISQFARTADNLEEIEGFRRLASQFYVAWQQNKWPWQVIPERVPPVIDQFLERTLLNPYLRVQMDGGAAEVASPLVTVDIQSVYNLSALIRSDSEDYEATAKLRLMDRNRKTLFEIPSKSVTGKSLWKSVSTESQYAYRDDIAYAQVVLQVLPLSSKAFRGEFGFDSIRIIRTPRLSLSVDKELAYYREGEVITARCKASGMTSDQNKISLSIVDHTGTVVDQDTRTLNRFETQQSRFVSKGNSNANTPAKFYWEGGCEWQPKALPPGYYELTTQLSKGKSGHFDLSEQFVVLPQESPRKPDARFGITMSTKNGATIDEVDAPRLIEILRLANVNRVKLPIWFDAQDPIATRAATDRIDRVQKSGMSCVGVIATPPQKIRSKFSRLNANDTGSALEDSLLAQSFLEPVLRQMCLRISEFQIGWDHETDFVSNPRIKPSLEAIKSLAKRYGQETTIFAARNPLVSVNSVSGIDRWQLYSPQPLTASEAENFTRKEKDAPPESPNNAPWLNLTPISANKYSLSSRVQDLASRMIKVSGEPGMHATTAWVSNPSDPDVGLLDKDGGPQEMFLPFRSMAIAMSGMRYIGSLPLRSLGINHLVASGDQAKLILWSIQPLTAQLYLGEQVTATDVWGRSVPIDTIPTKYGVEHRFSIDKWPIIVEGIDIRVARWRMGVTLEDSRIDPLIGQTQNLRVRFANPLPNPINGTVRVIAPAILAEESEASWEMDANSTETILVPMQVKPEANTSTASLRLGFTTQGERPVSFVVDQEVQVGTSDFEFDLRYEITQDNLLRMNIEATNHQSVPISFDCFLLVPNRPHGRTQIVNLKDRVTKSIVLDRANELVGQTLWLRCEQASSNRVMNYRIEITPE